MNYLKAILDLSKSVDKKYVPTKIIFTVLSTVFSVLSLLTMQSIINNLQLRSGEISTLVWLLTIYMAIDLLVTLGSSIFSYYESKFSMRFSSMLKTRTLEVLSGLTLKDYEDSLIYDKIKRVQTDTHGALFKYLSHHVSILKIVLSFILHGFILTAFNLWVTPVLFLIPFIKYLVTTRLNIKMFEIAKARTNSERMAWYYGYIMGNSENYKDLKIYNLFHHFIAKYSAFLDHFIRQDLSVLKEGVVRVGIIDVIDAMIIGALVAYFVYQGYVGAFLIGNLITYIRSISSIQTNIRSLFLALADVKKNSLHVGIVFDFFDLRLGEPDLSLSCTEKIKVGTIRCIQVKNLSYRYKDQLVLENLNFTINEGDFVAIIGRNGSGKTTLAKILMGFYDDYDGEIYVNGVELKCIDKEDYMARIGAVFQDFTRFEATIRENITYGNLSSCHDDNRLMNVARVFGIDDLIDSKPDGLDTQLGYMFSSGQQISLGEWQKVALCRAFVKDADLYVLDEPNAALDALSESAISALYRELFSDKIGIIIAHRFNTIIKNATSIVLLENGRIHEVGSHQELLRNKGLYYELYRTLTAS